MTSVAKDLTRLRRIYPNQNHNKNHTPGIIINYLIFYCVHILYLPFYGIHILNLQFYCIHILYFPYYYVIFIYLIFYFI